MKDKENYKPRTLIDHTLELIDPTPNIYTLFMQFNEHFFWNVLLPVEVKWSSRMTSCAGVCTFHPRSKQCIISLSAPLLKLRPRKDLVETLLHEMIHGYLFLTNNNRDRDGHGPEFCKHMNRINNAAGTKITIYHSFHNEVKLYQQHWWRCNGPCQERAPYFGIVRRATNRAPSPTDYWWKRHQQTCGGRFIKTKEPENFKARVSKNKDKPISVPKSNSSPNNILNWITRPTLTPPVISTPKYVKPSSNTPNSPNGLKKHGNSTNNVQGWGVKGPSGSNATPKTNKIHSNNQNSVGGLKKLGNSTNNVHGWGTGGPNSSNGSPKVTSVSNTPKFSSSGTVGGSNTGKSNLLDKFINSNEYPKSRVNVNTKMPDKTIGTFVNGKPEIPVNNRTFKEIKLVECPACSNFISKGDIDKHVEMCSRTTDKQQPTCKASAAKIQTKDGGNSLLPQKRKIDTNTPPNKQPKLDNSRITNCPVCNQSFALNDINDHLDKCLSETHVNDKNATKSDNVICINSSSDEDLSASLIEESNTYSVSKSQINEITRTNSFKCLVCNAFIPPETSLNDHLEDCIGSLFNDDSTVLIDCDDNETSDKASEISIDQTDKYPCPVCMELILESSMNQHLDVCLTNT
ncbi:DNA-dependent metalloprotease SPRTN isoform X2 [Lasioglossum baleicum]|uniref:DNA-dependent metalloprotease SPRTN isoform X2 n=1 Tax=Lasioglossum baleicum TaxID=434251 RepID=UPI003FCCF505